MAAKTLTRNSKETLPTPSKQINQANGNGHHEESEGSQKKRLNNPLMQSLNPRMLIEPYPIEGTELTSDEFACEKCCKLILQRLGFNSKKEWMQFADLCWGWNEQSEQRIKRLEAKKIANQVSEDPMLFEMLKEELTAI